MRPSDASHPLRGERCTVIGDGAMGTLCAVMLAWRGAHVTLWGAFDRQVQDLLLARENKRFLPGLPLPDEVLPTSDDGAAFPDPRMIISAVPCQYMRPVWTRLARFVPPDVPIVSTTKGLENQTRLVPTDILADCLGSRPLACLSGPTIASEVAQRKPASLVAASAEPDLATLVQRWFSTSFFRVYTSADVLGVELAGAVKNVIALAGGIADGIEAGTNAKAALVTRGLVELTRLGLAMGAEADTFRGLAGVGDLVTTCVSKASRNRTAGERIGRGEAVEEVIRTTASVIEGIPTTRSVLELARIHQVEMPIVEAVADVLFDGRRPGEAIEQLMTRELKAEQIA